MIGALDAFDERAHAQAGARMSKQWIDDELAGTVVGDLPAAIDVDDGDVARRQHVLALRVHAHREHGRMLEQPDLVGRVASPVSVRRCMSRQVGS